jgi:hypothetical protein
MNETRRTTDIPPSTHECVSNTGRAAKDHLGLGHQELLARGYVKIGLCRECLTRFAPCDVVDERPAATDPSQYIVDDARLGDCPKCCGPVFVTHDVQCEACGEVWFWWDLVDVTAADVEDGKNVGIVGPCPSCGQPCYLVGAVPTAEAGEAEEAGPPRGITGVRAKTDMEFRSIHRDALENLGEAYVCFIEATERLAMAEEFIGRMSASVVDEFDSIDGKPEWPSDAFAYYNEQLGAAGALGDMANALAERVSKISTGLREHDRRHVRKP